MAKSMIIKDIANGAIDTTTALKRAKILFDSLDNAELMDWVNYEITGYPTDAKLPDYRVQRGELKGSYFKGSMASHMKWTDVSIPLGKMPADVLDDFLSVSFYDGVNALKQLIEKADNGNLIKPIPADLFPYIAKCNNDPYMNIIAARVVVSTHCVTNIFSVIENRLLDALLLLEKEFGILDDLDIDTSTKSPEDIQTIAKKVYVIIYNDHSIHIGDGNKIKDTNIVTGKDAC